MAKIEPELKQGLMQRGWNKETCDKLWTDILDFAKYSFNKSHSAAYAITAYITMYLKCHYPGEFVTAAINSYDGDIAEISQVIGEAKRLGVNYCFDRWQNIKGTTTFDNGVVYLGINTIKGCGKNVSIALREVAEKNPNSFIELLQLLDDNENVDKSQIEALIRLNIFSEFGKRKNLYKCIT